MKRRILLAALFAVFVSSARVARAGDDADTLPVDATGFGLESKREELLYDPNGSEFKNIHPLLTEETKFHNIHPLYTIEGPGAGLTREQIRGITGFLDEARAVGSDARITKGVIGGEGE